jgi:hypothetical protein
MPTKIAMSFFTELEKLILKFIWKHKRPQIAIVILRAKLVNTELQIILQSHINKTMWY